MASSLLISSIDVGGDRAALVVSGARCAAGGAAGAKEAVRGRLDDACDHAVGSVAS
jgi:hypothetical protein